MPASSHRRSDESTIDELIRALNDLSRPAYAREITRRALETLLTQRDATLERSRHKFFNDRFFLNFSVDGILFCHVVVIAFWGAPRMARNFAALVAGAGVAGVAGVAGDVGYRGCAALQAWPRESLILGDVELNTGRGGRPARGARFRPDGVPLAGARGLLGMRRHGRGGLVGSQFRILLEEPRQAFTAWFGCVEFGIEWLDELSLMGDATGHPQRRILIADCGRLD